MPENVRLYGQQPYTIVAVHGGPGGIGEARPFAEELGKDHGVIEPFLQSESLAGQIAELKTAVEMSADVPVTLVGHSYGAMLSYIFAAERPSLVRRLIMISSGVLEAEDAESINETRNSRLTSMQRVRLETARATYKQTEGKEKERAFVELFTLIKQADAYNLIPHESDLAVILPKLYDSVWEDVQALRDSGRLAPYGRNIRCPVVAIHGDWDPRPATSIRNSLAKYVNNFGFILLKHCGHYPWYEKEAHREFYRNLRHQAT